MKDIVIKIDRKTSQVFLNKKVLGISGENLQGNLIFEFLDDFVDGVAWLELETSQTKGYLALIKEDNSYKLPILSSLLANKGNITMQLRITENEDANGIPIFKSNMFYLEVKEAINSIEEIKEQYPNWFDEVNKKIDLIKTDGLGNKYLSDDGTYKYVQGGSSDGGNVDLSNYATKDELDKKVDKVAGKSLIADSEIQRLASVSNYDDTSIRNELNSKADLSDIPAKISELTNDSGFITSIPMEYVTDEELNNKGYLTEHQDISHLANKNEIPTKTSELTNDSGFITDYTEKDPTVPSHVKSITTTDISNWNNKSNFDGNYNNLTNKPTIPTKTSQLTNDSLFASESYVKNEIANAQLGGGDTEIDLSGYATKDELLNKVDKELGKSLISDNEIERLSTITNYDDSSLRNLVNSKASIADMTAYIETNKEELRGEQGIQGIQGEKGDKGDKGDPGTNGVNGIDGKDGLNGTNGVDGKDGITPTIGENGNWFLGEEDTGKPSKAKDGILFFDNLASMKSANLKAGDYAKTSGYYSVNDGGAGEYLIREKSDTDVEDHGSIHFLNNGLVAELIIKNGTVNVKQFGAKGDNSTDDTECIKKAINYSNILYFPKGIYIINNTLSISKHITLRGYSKLSYPYNGSYLKFNQADSTLISSTANLEIDCLGIISDSGIFESDSNLDTRNAEPYNPYRYIEKTSNVNGVITTKKLKASNCYFSGFSGYALNANANAILTDIYISNSAIAINVNGYDPIFTNVYITKCKKGINMVSGVSSSIFMYNLWIDQIVEYGITGSGLAGVITGTFDHIGYSAMYFTGNTKQLMLDARINRCGIYYAGTDKDSISNEELMKASLLYLTNIYYSQIKLTTEYRDIGSSTSVTNYMSPKVVLTVKQFVDSILYCDESENYTIAKIINTTNSNGTLISQNGIKKCVNGIFEHIYNKDGITSTSINSIEVVDSLPTTEVEGVLYLVKEVIETIVNLYPSQVETSVSNGVTITFKDKNIIADGSNNTTSVWATSNKFAMDLEANKEYYLQFNYESGTMDDSNRIASSDGVVTSIFLIGYDSSGNATNLVNEIERTASGIYEKYKFTPTQEYVEYVLKFQVKKYVTCSEWTLSVVVAEEIDDGNLYDYSTASILNNAKVEGTTIVAGSNQNKITYLQVEPNTTYTISKTVNEHFGIGLSTEEPVIGTVFNTYSNDATLSEATITTGDNDNYLAIYYWTSYDTGTEEEIRSSIVVTKVS